MRIRRLDLKAYGPFTEQSLHFCDAGNMDIVYGLNEAGKSSALRALSGLLYGIPARTGDSFLHSYRNLRIGGQLVHSDGSTLEFVRKKGNKNTLLRPDGTVIPDSELLKYIGSVSEEQFGQLFGLDHHTLVEGGRIILEGKGELGESLLAAGTGGVSVRRLLQSLEEEAEALFVPRGKSKLVNAKLVEYEAARKSAQELSLSVAVWEKQSRDLETASNERDRLAAEINECRKEKSRLERLQQALPLIADRAGLLEKLEELGEVAILPEDFAKRRREAEDLITKANEILRETRNEVKLLEEEIHGLEVPEALLVQEENITALYKRLGSYNKAMEDLPQRVSEHDELHAAARALLGGIRPDLDLAGAEALRGGLSAKSNIQRLAREHRGITAKIETSQESIHEEQARLGEVRGEIAQLETPRDISALKAALKALQAQGNLNALYKELEEEIAKEKSQAQVELSRLRLWEGTLEELEALPVPDLETVDGFEEAMHKNGSELEDKRKEIERLGKELAKEQGTIKRLQVGGEVSDEESLLEARSRRDLGWTLVKRAWLDGEDISLEEAEYDADRRLPEAYEAKVAEADDVADSMRREADRVAELAQSRLRMEEIGSDLAAAKADAEKLQGELERTEAAWVDAWKGAGLRPLRPREMRSWLSRHAKLVQGAQKIRGLELRLKSTRESMQSYAKKLADLLVSLGEAAAAEEGLEMVAARAQGICEHVDEVESERKRLARSGRDASQRLESCQEGLQSAQAELKEWKKEWGESLAGLELPPDTEPDKALSLVDKLGEIFQKLDDAKKLNKRVADMRDDAHKFSQDVDAFTAAYAPDLSGAPFEQAVAELHARLLKAKEEAAKKTEKQSRHDRQKKIIEEAESDVKKAEMELKALCLQAKCERPEGLDEAEERDRKCRELKDGLKQVERQLLHFQKGEPLEQLLAEAAEIDADALPGKLEELESRIQEEDERCSQLDRDIGSLRNELERMDGNQKAAEEAERAEAALASLRPLVERYSVLQAAMLLLREEAERYRQRTQDPVLARAGEVFSRLTADCFRGLDIDFGDDDRPVIVGVRSGGEKVGVEGMSDGTCDQLYLALRIASIEAYLERNEPFPFIVDDILIRFDDERAGAALETLMRLAEKTQVIFFTHHSRLVESARKIGAKIGAVSSIYGPR